MFYFAFFLCSTALALMLVIQIGIMDRKLKSLMKQQQRIETTRFHPQAAGGAAAKSRSPSPGPAMSTTATARPSGTAGKH